MPTPTMLHRMRHGKSIAWKLQVEYIQIVRILKKKQHKPDKNSEKKNGLCVIIHINVYLSIIHAIIGAKTRLSWNDTLSLGTIIGNGECVERRENEWHILVHSNTIWTAAAAAEKVMTKSNEKNGKQTIGIHISHAFSSSYSLQLVWYGLWTMRI